MTWNRLILSSLAVLTGVLLLAPAANAQHSFRNQHSPNIHDQRDELDRERLRECMARTSELEDLDHRFNSRRLVGIDSRARLSEECTEIVSRFTSSRFVQSTFTPRSHFHRRHSRDRGIESFVVSRNGLNSIFFRDTFTGRTFFSGVSAVQGAPLPTVVSTIPRFVPSHGFIDFSPFGRQDHLRHDRFGRDRFGRRHPHRIIVLPPRGDHRFDRDHRRHHHRDRDRRDRWEDPFSTIFDRVKDFPVQTRDHYHIINDRGELEEVPYDTHRPRDDDGGNGDGDNGDDDDEHDDDDGDHDDDDHHHHH